MNLSGWMTIPEWSSVRQVNVFHREQEKPEVPESTDHPENLHVLVRGTVFLPANPDGGYELWVTADDHYQLWIDGVYRGQGPMSSYSECAFYDTYSIKVPGLASSDSVFPLPEKECGRDVPGTHDGKQAVTIALHLYYHGRISRSWTSGDGRFGFWASIREKEEPHREVACADESWQYQICRAYSGETVGYNTQFLENFDSRLWPEGWEQPGSDTDTQAGDEASENQREMWGHLVPALWADCRMLPRSIQPLDEKAVSPVRRWEKGDDSGNFDLKVSVGEAAQKGQHCVVLDFGREITGAVVAEAAGPVGSQVLIQCAEELSETQELLPVKERSESSEQIVTEGSDGASEPGEEASIVDLPGVPIEERGAFPQVRWNMRCGCTYQETWTLKKGISRLHPYDYKGFRYAQLIFPKTVELRQVYAWVRHYPMKEDACTLWCEDREVEQIFEICKNAVRCCSQDAYLDCPTREKGQYLGDALITARAQVWLTGSTELLRKCIADFILSASISPSLMAVAPGSEMQEIADYSLLFPLLPMTDYAFTGDRNYLARCYPAVREVTESFLVYQRKDGLLENVRALWNMVDWPENLRDHYDFPLTRPVVGEGCHNVINALWYGANRVQEAIECLLGLPVTGRCEQIADAFRKAFYRTDQRLFADSEISMHCSIHANLYAAFFGLLPKEGEEPYVRMLRTPGRVCGVMPAYFALKSLAQMGRAQDCFDLMMRSDEYGWRNMIREGASASFEAWGKEQKWNTSLCHAWSSGFVSLLIEEVAGLHPDPERPEGYRLETPDIRCPAFHLQVPWRGKRLILK